MQKYLETKIKERHNRKTNKFKVIGKVTNFEYASVGALVCIKEGITERSIMEIMRNDTNAVHPTQKPVRLIERLILITSASEGDIILDAFMGSGATGVACERLNRRFIGIEREQAYFDIACKRIEAETKQAKLNLKTAV